MSVEIRFPIEFTVRGTPVSLQAKRPEFAERMEGASQAG
jgi:hypothetical protein